MTGATTLTGNATLSGAVTAPSLYGKAQRETTDAAFTIAADTMLLVLAVDPTASRIVTMPAATAGRHFKVFWEVEQATSDWVFTRAGSDTMGGNIYGTVEGNAAGDGDVTAVALTTTAITFVDDVNIGSTLEFYCAAAGQWLVEGHLIVDAVGTVPTLA